MNRTWLQRLEPGDPVLFSKSMSREMGVTSVERLTQTQVITKNGMRWRKKDGKLVGSTGWSARWIFEATPKALAAAKRAIKVDNARHAIRSAAAEIGRMSDDEVIKVGNAIRAARGLREN